MIGPFTPVEMHALRSITVNRNENDHETENEVDIPSISFVSEQEEAAVVVHNRSTGSLPNAMKKFFTDKILLNRDTYQGIMSPQNSANVVTDLIDIQPFTAVRDKEDAERRSNNGLRDASLSAAESETLFASAKRKFTKKRGNRCIFLLLFNAHDSHMCY